MIIVTNYQNKNKNVFSSYLFEYGWHNMLGHVNYNSMQISIIEESLQSMI
jgi:hypothetical protein